MISAELRKLVQPTPFRPFRLHLADGRAVEVPHPEYIFVFHREPLAIVEKLTGGTEYVNLPIVTSVEILGAADAA